MTRKTPLIRCCQTVLVGATILPVYAAPVLEEVIVTAQKRNESVQDVPISVNAVAGDTLEANGITNLEDMAGLVPNLNIADSPDGNMIVMRGLGSGTGNPSFEQSVGLYVDGIYAARGPQFQIPFLDVERVEVLRGPQGVLFGKNSIAGAIAIHSKKPEDITEVTVSSAYVAPQGTSDFSLVLSGPISKTIAGRLVAKKGSSGEFVYNGVSQQDEQQNDVEALRGILSWSASDNTDVMLKLETGKYTEEGTNFQISDYDRSAPPALLTQSIVEDAEAGGEDFEHNYTGYSNGEPSLWLNSKSATLSVAQYFGEYELSALGGYSRYDRVNFSDVDFSASNLLHRQQEEDYEQSSLEVRFLSPVGQTVEYVTGLYYIERELIIPRARIDVDYLRPPLNTANGSLYSTYDEKSESWSAFGQLTWNISDFLRASIGLRYSQETKSGAGFQSVNEYGTDEQTDTSNPLLLPAHLARVQVAEVLGARPFSYDLSREEEVVDGTFNLQFDVTDNAMMYFTTAKATKAGGYNATSISGDPDDWEFDEEQAITYEIGLKSDVMDRRGRVNLAVFYTRFDDLQVSSFDGASFKTGNAASAISKGVELETNFAVTETWLFGANAAYLSATYEEYIGSCPLNQNVWSQSCRESNGATQDLAGKSLDQAPEWSGTLFLDYQNALSEAWLIGFRVDTTYSDDYIYNPVQDPNSAQEAFWKVNAQLSLSTMDGMWSISLNGYNLTDERTKNFGGEVLQAPGLYWANTQAPRQYGLSLKYHFER